MDFECKTACETQFAKLIRKDDPMKEEAIAYSIAGKLATQQTLDKMPRLKPLLRQREAWLKRMEN